MNKSLSLLGLAAVALGAGCRQEAPTTFEANLVHSYKYELTRDLPMDQVVKDTQWALTDLFGTPDQPKIPQFIAESEDYAGLVAQERLDLAGGPEIYDESGKLVGGLYRGHCSNCHGITGTGRGPTAAGVVPYPRDYRLGIFKYKSTSRGSKPTREDIAKLIRHGIGGTAMNPIEGLNEEGVQALIDYVIYLSWRGEVERQMIDGAMFDLDLEAGDRVINPDNAILAAKDLQELTEEESAKLEALNEKIDAAMEDEIASLIKANLLTLDDTQLKSLVDEFAGDLEAEQLEALMESTIKEASTEDVEALLAIRYENLSERQEKEIRDKIAKRIGSSEEVALLARQSELDAKDLYQENWSYIVEAVEDIAGAWLDAEEDVTEIVPADSIPVPQDRAAFIAMMEGEQAEALKASVERGHKLFTSELVGCAKCHGKEGKGDGQTNDYDDWTKDWTVTVGLDPKDTPALIPLMARGAWEPRNIKPRNFAEGVFRGGSSPDDLYRRIANGIAGTPMPAATFVEGEFSEEDIWHLINFIRSLDQSEPQEDASNKPAVTEAAMR